MKIFGKKALSVFFCGLFLFILTSAANGQNVFRKINDFDGDGKADFAITRSIDGYKYWYVWQSTNGFSVVQFGLAADQNYTGDYDGDGKWDFAVHRQQPANAPNFTAHSFWLRYSQTGAVGVELFDSWNGLPYSSFQQDYDGDGKTDVAVIATNPANAQSIFVVRQSLLGEARTIGSSSGWKNVRTGDMTGDGKADPVRYNQNTFDVEIVNSANGVSSTVRFGTTGDQYLPADFDGDGKGDLTVFRPSDGSWWWLRSSDYTFNAATFGTSGDVPVPADYDGDGKTDIAIYRSGAQSYFWVYGSQVGVFALPWGIANDTVVRY